MTSVQGLSFGRALALYPPNGLSLALPGASIACWMSIRFTVTPPPSKIILYFGTAPASVIELILQYKQAIL